MSRVTIKYVIDFYDNHREYFANYITKGIHADLVMNSDKTPAELLNSWNNIKLRGNHIGLTKEQFNHYYPNVDFDKLHEMDFDSSEEFQLVHLSWLMLPFVNFLNHLILQLLES